MPNEKAMLTTVLSLLTCDELDTLDLRMWAKQVHPTIRGRIQDEIATRSAKR